MENLDLEYMKVVLRRRNDTTLNPDFKIQIAFNCIEKLINHIEAINGQNINS